MSGSRHLLTRNISSKSMHAFLSNLAKRQTDRQTHLPLPLSEVINENTKNRTRKSAMRGTTMEPILSLTGDTRGHFGTDSIHRQADRQTG